MIENLHNRREHLGLKIRCFAAGCCVLIFILAQAFQELAYRLWIPEPQSAQDELLTYLSPVDQARALLVLGSILFLIVPYSVVALSFRQPAPLACAIGLFSAIAFIGFETTLRSIDFFVVGQRWAHQLQTAANDSDRQTMVDRLSLFKEFMRAWYFPLLLSHLSASSAFAFATFQRRYAGWWLAPVAFTLNALRLLGRFLAMFGGQTWLDSLNNQAYFPGVLIVNVMIAAWFFVLAG